MPKVTEQMYRDEVQKYAMNFSQWITATSNYPVRPVDDEPNPKPETYILCFPNGNMAAIRREAFVEAVGQVIARQDEIAANYRKFFENL
jgi:hypothetical protein